MLILFSSSNPGEYQDVIKANIKYDETNLMHISASFPFVLWLKWLIFEIS